MGGSEGMTASSRREPEYVGHVEERYVIQDQMAIGA
jgi:hypothetical protein